MATPRCTPTPDPTTGSAAPPPRARARHRGRRAAAGTVLIGTALLGTIGCSAAAQEPPVVNVEAAGPTGTGPANGITIEGTGEVEGAPDTLSITFGVSVKRDTVDAAVKDNATVATSMLQALLEQGVEEKDVQTRNYSVQPSYTYDSGTPVPDGYQVTNSVTVQLHDLEGSGAAIDAVTAAGGDAVQVQGVAFSLEDDSAVVTAAREQAFNDARGKAEQFASLSGRPLGQVESVTETTQRNEDQLYRASAGAFAEDSASSTPVSPGEVTTSVTVTVRYALG